MNRGAWQATAHRITKNWTQLKRLSTHSLGLSFDMWNLLLQHVGSSFLTRDGTQAPCTGSLES